MSIEDFKEKIKLKAEDFLIVTDEPQKSFKLSDGLFLAIVFILITIGAFWLGKISSLEKKKEPISVYRRNQEMSLLINNLSAPEKVENLVNNIKGTFVASKSGTKFYYPWCSGVDKIKEENKVWFATVEEALSRGLQPASNCPGLK